MTRGIATIFQRTSLEIPMRISADCAFAAIELPIKLVGQGQNPPRIVQDHRALRGQLHARIGFIEQSGVPVVAWTVARRGC